jgi:hypothetical protein
MSTYELHTATNGRSHSPSFTCPGRAQQAAVGRAFHAALDGVRSHVASRGGGNATAARPVGDGPRRLEMRATPPVSRGVAVVVAATPLYPLARE